MLDNWNDIYLIIYTSVIFSRMCMKAVVICLDWALIYWKHRSNSKVCVSPSATMGWQGLRLEEMEKMLKEAQQENSQTGGESSEYHNL